MAQGGRSLRWSLPPNQGEPFVLGNVWDLLVWDTAGAWQENASGIRLFQTNFMAFLNCLRNQLTRLASVGAWGGDGGVARGCGGVWTWPLLLGFGFTWQGRVLGSLTQDLDQGWEKPPRRWAVQSYQLSPPSPLRSQRAQKTLCEQAGEELPVPAAGPGAHVGAQPERNSSGCEGSNWEQSCPEWYVQPRKSHCGPSEGPGSRFLGL